MTSDAALPTNLLQMPTSSEDLEDGSTAYDFPSEEGDDIGNQADPDETSPDLSDDHQENLAKYLTVEELRTLANLVIEGYKEDETSRGGHIQTIVKAISSLGLSDSAASVPFEGACTVYHPLLLESAVKLQAKASNELLPANGPVKTRILGTVDENDAMEHRASRIKAYMNWQTTTQMPEYIPNSEKAFLHASLLGDSFKKKYPDMVANRIKDQLITLDRLVVNNSVESLISADRITELQPISEVTFKQRVYSGLYDDVVGSTPYRLERTDLQMKIDDLLGLHGEETEGYNVIEQHLYYDLPGFEDRSGVPLPYIVHVERESSEVLGIYRNWCEGESKFVKREWYAHYGFVPAFGFYHLGYIHLLGNFQRTLTAILRSLVDSGQFANMQGGFKSKTMRILENNGEPFAPGEWRDVENFGADIRTAFAPLPTKEPSQTLYELLQFIEARGQKFADSTESVLADSTNYGPVGTTMALLDASTKFFSAIHKRFHNAQKQELAILAYLNYEFLPADDSKIEFNVPGETIQISREDFHDRIEICPVSDPNISSNAHRMTMANTKLQAANQKPEIHDMREIYKEFYKAMGVENVDKILPPPQSAQPLDPVGDIQAASKGQPIQAFPDQDHDTHIAVKQAFLQSIATNPVMAPTAQAITSNIRDHTAFKFAHQVQGTMQAGQLDMKTAAAMVMKNNAFLASNPGAEQDPKTILALAEKQNAVNESIKIDHKNSEVKNKLLLELAQMVVTMRGQDLQLMAHGQKLDNDAEQNNIGHAMNLVSQILEIESTPDPAPPAQQ